MLSRLRFKNWRSLHDVAIEDLTPLTVLIGANSSGKSNIVDGLSFLRRIRRDSSQYSVSYKAGNEEVRTIGVNEEEPVEIEITFQPKPETVLDYLFSIRISEQEPYLTKKLATRDGKFDLHIENGRGRVSYASESSTKPIQVSERDGEILPDEPLGEFTSVVGRMPLQMAPLEQTFQFIDQRWQLLAENFMPARRLQADETGDVYLIDQEARNTVLLLDFMQQAKPDLYEKLQEDLRWLIGHVERIGVKRVYPETRLLVQEKPLAGKEAPTISGGTSRLIAILTAFYALEMREPARPGLVVVEEPDMAVHPLLLKNFVELLRTYVEGEYPRQFILTTHNPRLLDFFDPSEVRIVQRDEHGHTTVRRVPEHIRDVWLSENTLGEVWMTRSLGDMD